MLNIEIKGVQFSNKGAELMLVAILAQLDKTLDEYQITLAPGIYLPYLKRAKLGAWQKLSFHRGNINLTGLFGKLPNRILNFIKRYGIVTEKDIDVILDASGFAYGEQWGSDSLKQAVKEVARFQQQGKKYIFLPQAFGPFKSDEVRQLSAKVFANADLVFPRGNESYQAIIDVLTEILPESKADHIKQAPDFTCLVEPKPFETDKSNGQTICIIPNNKMMSTFHHKNASDDAQSYINFLVQAGKYYQQLGWQVVLLNHEGKVDQGICQNVAEQLSNGNFVNDSQHGKITIKNDLSAVDIKAYIASVDAVISSRFHGCVSALTQGIPCLATTWSHKYQMLFQEYGVGDNVVDFKISQAELQQSLTLFNDNLLSQKIQCSQHAKKVKAQTRHMWQQVFSTLKL